MTIVYTDINNDKSVEGMHNCNEQLCRVLRYQVLFQVYLLDGVKGIQYFMLRLVLFRIFALHHRL